MATSTPAHVTPEVLRWARESIGYDLLDEPPPWEHGEARRAATNVAGADLAVIERVARLLRRGAEAEVRRGR